MRNTPLKPGQPLRFTMLRLAALLLAAWPLSAPWAGTAETARAECSKQLGLPPAVCTCIGKRSEKDLNPKQQKLFLAVITKDPTARAAAQKGMTVDEMTATASFMNTVPNECSAP